MLSLVYRRFGNGIYISHTDVLRSLNRTMRRAGINVNYSNGFNRHMEMKLTQPLPLGIASNDEWMTVDVVDKLTTEEFLTKFNENCPPFLVGIRAFETEKNPQLAAKIEASGYHVANKKAFSHKKEIEELKQRLIVEYDKKGEHIVKDVTDCVYGIRVTEDGIICVLAFGNKNLRIDVFCNELNRRFGLDIALNDIVRETQFVKQGDNLIKTVKYMEKQQ